MKYTLDLTGYTPQTVAPLGGDFTCASVNGDIISVNSSYITLNGRPFFAVSGELHYSRLNPERWEDEILKMRAGGVNIVSTYLFWNHIEEDEGVFDFTGRNDIGRFVRLCARHGLFVILRVGPFAHGEARNGGLPDWLYGKPFEVRTTSGGFMFHVKRLYDEIGRQVRGLFFKDGGPVIGVQLDNEYMHSAAQWELTTGISVEWITTGYEGEKYLLKLRELALSAGLTPAFFTATAWGGAAYCDKLLPLWGGYAYWPWIFYSHRGEHPATPGYVYEDYCHDGKSYADDYKPAYKPSERPYACCEMGGGMMNCYYYRFQLDYKSVDAMANIKLGSGCNFLGYYMFHGGTHPLGRHGAYMNESQVAKRSYDYQACLGEFGQVRESYKRVKTLHYFLQSFGDKLAPLETVLPEGASQIDPSDLDTLRYCVRTDGRRGFLFVNNFQDHRVTPDKKNCRVELTLKDETIGFDTDIASGENAILPFNLDMDGMLLKYAQAQPVTRCVLDGRVTYVFMVPDGMTEKFVFEDGIDIVRTEGGYTVSQDGKELDILLLTRARANDLYRRDDGTLLFTDAALLDGERIESTSCENGITAVPGGRRTISTQPREIHVTATPCAPHRWLISVPYDAVDGVKDVLLSIRYRGDIATLWLENEMVSDNFCNGDTWEVGLKDFAERLRGKQLVLNIAPVRNGATVNVESAMAGRSETVASLTAELLSVKAVPVYEMKI